MDIDFDRMFSAVEREVLSREHEGRPAWVIKLARTFDTDVEDLWDALTNPDRIPIWFLPITGDLTPGGHYQLESNAGGTIMICEAPRRLAVTWEYDGTVSWLTLSLTPAGDDSAHLTLEHIAHEDESWEQYGPGAGGVGWDLALIGLELHLEHGEGFSASEVEAWMETEAARRFITMSSEDWIRASTEAGTDPAQARAAGDRTTAFYTGEGESPAQEQL